MKFTILDYYNKKSSGFDVDFYEMNECIQKSGNHHSPMKDQSIFLDSKNVSHENVSKSKWKLDTGGCKIHNLVYPYRNRMGQ